MASIVDEAVRLLSESLTHPIEELPLLKQALLFAEISKIAYYTPDIVWEAVEAVGFEQYRYFDRDGAQAYLLTNQHDVVIVCRGTEPHEINDLKADIDAVSVVVDTVGRMHRGFKSEVDHLWPMLEQALKENDKPLWFTGHSLGGAMATICAGRCKLAEIPSNPTGLFTFGAPRVGNRRYINYVKIPHYRFVNNNDVVCRMPPVWLGYSHSGREFYFNAFGRLRKYRPWRRFRDRLHGLMLSLRKWRIDYLSDHSMHQYIACIQRAIADEATGKIPKVMK